MTVVACLGVPGCAESPVATGRIDAARSIDEKCQAIYEWASEFKDDYSVRYKEPLNADIADVANLYRDKYFVPVFGFTYDSSNVQRLERVTHDVLPPCYGVGKPRKASIVSKMARFQYFLDRGFPFNEKIASTITERRKIERWMQEVLDYTKHLAPTRENLQDLEEYVWAARRDVSMMWPSEQQEFLDQLEERLAALSKASSSTVSPPSAVNTSKVKPSSVPLPRSNPIEDGGRTVMFFDSVSRLGVIHSLAPPGGFEYRKATGPDGSTDATDRASLRQVDDWLASEGYACLYSLDVVWNGLNYSYTHKGQSNTMAVIDCRGNCRGFRYNAIMGGDYIGYAGGTIFLLAKTLPLPVLKFVGQGAATEHLGGYIIGWKLSRPNPNRSPDVRIHIWQQRYVPRGKSSCWLQE
jgi:hypothetical protein